MNKEILCIDREIENYKKFISDLKNIQEKNEKKLENYKSILENSPGGLVKMELNSEDVVKPVFISEGFLRITKMSRQEMEKTYAKDVFDGVHPDDYIRVKEKFYEILVNKGKEFHDTYRLITGDGTYVWVQVTSSTSIENGIKVYNVAYLDVTDRVKIEEEQFLQKQKLEITIEYSNLMYFEYDIKNHIAYGNKKIVDTFNVSGVINNFPEEWLKAGYVHKNDEIIYRNAFKNIDNGSSYEEFQVRLYNPPEKKWKWLRFRCNVIYDKFMNPERAICGVDDISPFKEIEEMIESTVEKNFDFIGLVDIEKEVVEYSVNFYNSTKKGIKNIKNINYYDVINDRGYFLISEQDKERILKKYSLENIRRELKEQDKYVFTYNIVDVSGDIKTKSTQCYYIDDQNKKICITSSDVTESIKDKQNLLNLLVNTVERAGIIDVETGNYIMHTVDTVKKGIQPLNGEDFENYCYEVLIENNDEATADEYFKNFKIKNILKNLNKNINGYDITYTLKEKNKLSYKIAKIFWVDNNHTHIGFLRTDITVAEVKYREQKQILTGALNLAEEANNAKSDFLAAMSHDLRTPMNAIVGMTEIALSEPDNHSQILESLDIVKHSSKQLLGLLNDLLEMSRIESGKMIFTKEKFSHSLEYKKLLERIERTAKIKNITLRQYFSIKNDVCIGDPLKIHRILDNLLSNAIKFTNNGGEISIQIEEHPYDKENYGLYQIKISDNGLGMDDETKNHIFEPFYRSKRKESRIQEGSGLGLSIVKKIIDFSDGVIEVESELNKGTIFTVKLPIRLANSSMDIGLNNEIKNEVVNKNKNKDYNFLTGKNVLLVEDHPINQRVAIKILEKINMNVVVAENGKIAVDLFEKKGEEFDIILMDIQMPEMNGYEATKLIRNSHKKNSKLIPIIAMTANAFTEDMKKSLEVGMNKHLSKPIIPEKLYKILNEYS